MGALLLALLVACGPGEVVRPPEPEPECEPTLGGEEWCDGVDNDCDGTVDEGGLDGVVWYPDFDGDGWGVDSPSEPSCAPPDGHAGRAGDCDDSQPLMNPGMEEICEDGLDNDCDGSAGPCGLGGNVEQGAADVVLWGIDPGDRAGMWVAPGGDLDRDGRADVLVASPFRDAGALSAGEVALVSAITEGERTLWEGIPLSGAWSEQMLGVSAVVPGDLDGDGWADVVAADEDHEAWVFLGPFTEGRSVWEADASFTCAGDVYASGDANGDGLADVGCGHALHLGPEVGGEEPEVWFEALGPESAGDLDGDGQSDLVLDEPEGVWVVHGPVSPGIVADPDAWLWSEPGHGVGAGDVDGDGYGDLLVGYPEDDEGGMDAGRAALVLGPFPENRQLDDVTEANIRGERTGDEAGKVVDSAGDVDADGRADLLVAAPYEDGLGDQTGAVYLLYGPVTGLVDLYRADFTLRGIVEGGRAGESMAGPGDVDGDGFDDVLVGAKRAQREGIALGAALIFKGGVGW